MTDDEHDDARPVIELCPQCQGVTVAQHQELGRLRRGPELSPPRCTTPGCTGSGSLDPGL